MTLPYPSPSAYTCSPRQVPSDSVAPNPASKRKPKRTPSSPNYALVEHTERDLRMAWSRSSPAATDSARRMAVIVPDTACASSTALAHTDTPTVEAMHGNPSHGDNNPLEKTARLVRLASVKRAGRTTHEMQTCSDLAEVRAGEPATGRSPCPETW